MCFQVEVVWVKAYSSLCELAGTLVLGVTEEFNNATLVGSET